MSLQSWLIQSKKAHAKIITRQPAVVCGRPWVDEVLRQVDATITSKWHTKDGDQVQAGALLLELSGMARSLLTAERTALNFLQLLCGTATRTNTYVQMVEGTRATLLDTRKTIPGLRLAQKYAVKTGGAENHRIGLFDAFLIKENHIAAAGSIAAAIEAARQLQGDLRVEVEVEAWNNCVRLSSPNQTGSCLITLRWWICARQLIWHQILASNWKPPGVLKPQQN